MRHKKKIIFGMLLLFAIVLFSFISAYSITTPQFASPGNSFSYLSRQGVGAFPLFDENKCHAGQDFVIQIAPFGCTPSVVRSDLLEEQNVPVFCQLYATKINPLIDVKAVDFISFTGEYPKEIQGIGFHPAKAALRNTRTTLLNSPVLENIGYAVIVLKQQKNESSMPEFVSGNLTANIRYDIENAFGVGAATQYIPELKDSEWQEKYSQYGFWDGKAFLRAEGIDENSAIISLYNDANYKISTFTLEKGQTSGDIFLPGLYCQAGLRLRLDDVKSPDTRAKLDINGEIVEVAEGEKFLDNQCNTGVVEKKGITKKVNIACKTDEGSERFEFEISPKIKLKIEGEEKEISLGQKVFTTPDNEKSVYLAYIGTERETENVNDLFVYFLAVPEHKESLSESELASASFLARAMESPEVSGERGIDALVKLTNKYIGWTNRFAEYLLSGKNWKVIRYNEEEDVFGKKIKIVGFSEPEDSKIEGIAKEYFESSLKDYREIISSFAGEKENPNSQETFGLQAFRNMIKLSSGAEQKKTLSDLCEEFKEKYPKNIQEFEKECNNFKLANEERDVFGVVINGKTKIISLEDVSEPSLDDFSAEILVRKTNSQTQVPHILTKNEILALSDALEFVYIYRLKNSISLGLSQLSLFQIYLGFIEGEWKWSSDKNEWLKLSETKTTYQVQPVFPNTQIKNYPVDISNYEYENKKILQELFGSLKEKNADDGKKILTGKPYEAVDEINEKGSDYIQLKDLTLDSARVKIHFKNTGTDLEATLKRNDDSSYGDYVFTLTKINLKKVAKVSVVPDIKNAGTKANFSFNIGIEKRAIQLSPDKIQERIENLNKSIEKWEENSEKLGEGVRVFNAACLATGTTLTIKNLFQNFDGRAIARQEVMRSSGGWMELCKDKVNRKEFTTIDNCLYENNDKIEKDVNLVAGIIKNQEGINETNAKLKLVEIRNKLGNKISNPEDEEGKEFIDSSENSDVGKAFTEQGLKENKISLSQARDVERLKLILESEPSPELKSVAEKRLYSILTDIKANSEDFSDYSSIQDELREAGLEDIGVNSYGGKDAIEGVYSGGIITKNKIQLKENQQIDLEEKNAKGEIINYPTEVVIYKHEKYLLLLQGEGNYYHINKVYNYDKIESGKVEVSAANPDEEREVRQRFSRFVKYDEASYKNEFKDAQVRFFEVEPYKGMPAIVPFDTRNGWYAATKQTLPGFGKIRAYDDSGQITSFYLCNVGKNEREEFNSNLGDEICRNFNPGLQSIQGEFPGLSLGETNRLVSRAIQAIEEAGRQYKPGLAEEIKILNEFIDVGEPSAGVPDIQCQDFMSPKECLLLFNVCDPVVCPSSRCDLGGTYRVPDVIQSGVIGSVALCLPNAREKIAVPVCLTGIKAGIDSWISVEKNYRDCLQTNLETGETIGICDEIHSVYLCDLFWSQTQPFAKIIVPKIFEVILGQTGRGGGEYLGVASAWENAGKSVDYMTNYYGAASFEAFKTGIIKEVGNSICRSFVSASYPSGDFFDSLIEPESPPQYTAWFSEQPFTTSTVPATSRYKVFYHIFAGKNNGEAGRNAGAFYDVYLKSPQGTSFFSFAPQVSIASGFIPPGEFASETKDFTAPAGYQQLCIRVNKQEECGFNRVTTDFGLDYLNDLYMKEQAGATDIKSESECVAGTPSLYSFVNPNVQEGLQDYVDPAIYSQQVVRVCSTENPGKGTDVLVGTEGSRWVQVGKCDETGKLKCYLDQESVKKVIKSTEIENATLKDVSLDYVEQLKKEGEFLNDSEKEIEKINKLDSQSKINFITSDLIAKAFLNSQKAKLIMLRANAYASLVLEKLGVIKGGEKETATGKSETPTANTGAETISAGDGGSGGATANYENLEYHFKVKASRSMIYVYSKGWYYIYGGNYVYGNKDNWKSVNDKGKSIELKTVEFFKKNIDVTTKLNGMNFENGLKILVDNSLSNKWELSTDNIIILSSDKIFTIKQKNGISLFLRNNKKWEAGYKQSNGEIKWEDITKLETDVSSIISSENKDWINSLSGKNNFDDGAILIFKTSGVEPSGETSSAPSV